MAADDVERESALKRTRSLRGPCEGRPARGGAGNIIVAMISIAAFAVTGLLVARAAAQDAGGQDEMRKQLEAVNALSREIGGRVRAACAGGGNALTELQTLRTMDREYEQEGEMERQVLALMIMEKTAVLGNYAEALHYADLSDGPTAWAPVPDGVIAGFEPQDALDALADLAADEQLVLINEAHHVPQHRAFTLRLLERLRPLGFTCFAAETLSEADTDLNERGYPTSASGAYIDEPVYGDLVRTALRLGYRVVAYESLGGRDRELGQARNLVERILAKDPDARVVVHAGYAHIDEQGTIAGAAAMAVRLEELTGIDPLTVDQTVMTERSMPEREHPLYRTVASSIHVASIFRNAAGDPWTLEPGRRDVTLFHPRSTYEHGRPTWLRLGGARKPYALPDGVCGDAPRCLVRARAAGESTDAVPVDQVEVVAGEPPPALLLPPGEYALESRGLADEELWAARIDVE